VLCRTISGRGQLRKSPRKSSRWDLFPEPDSVTSRRLAQLRIKFSLRKKKNGSRKPEMVYITFDIILTRPEPGPDPNIICDTRPGPRAVSRVPGPSPHRPLHHTSSESRTYINRAVYTSSLNNRVKYTWKRRTSYWRNLQLLQPCDDVLQFCGSFRLCLYSWF
jgi:hypothetical protein